ncbi:hypothetical protein AAP_03007 [Ascosphaera apis ARSEF 7405]|uniref:Uncharacterized protein n=1 Tax=Ascosphaera apis ARSEF 7405 TaxID=392613 RepID=A0A167Z9D5_9EURO|nr:hypothetical protein AAP_03007 [Ascosphaera apis ARSEF 7405]
MPCLEKDATGESVERLISHGQNEPERENTLDDGQSPQPVKPILKKVRVHEGPLCVKTEQISASTSEKPKPRSVSPFELLPSSILQKIFFLANLECNMALCSPLVARRLSSERIYRALTLLAFWDENETWTGESEPWLEERYAAITGVEEPIDFAPHLSDGAKRRLQQGIMKLRWFTLERVKALKIEVMCNLLRNITWFREPVQMATLQMARLVTLIEAAPTEHKGVETVYAREQAGEWLRIHVSASPSFTLEIHSHFCGQRLCYPGRLLAIPDNRLHGTPWNVKKIAFLNELRSLFAINDSLAISMSRRAVHQGIVTAMAKGDLEALRIILKYNVVAYAKDRQELALKKQYHLCPQYFKIAQKQENSKAIKKVLKKHIAEQKSPASEGDANEGTCQVWTRQIVRRTFSKKANRSGSSNN